MNAFKPLLPLLFLLGLAACGGGAAAPDRAIGMANPASRYCADLGGQLEVRREEAGEAGYCHMPDGSVVEEWQLFRGKNSL